MNYLNLKHLQFKNTIICVAKKAEVTCATFVYLLTNVKRPRTKLNKVPQIEIQIPLTGTHDRSTFSAN